MKRKVSPALTTCKYIIKSRDFEDNFQICRQETSLVHEVILKISGLKYLLT